LFTIDVLSYPEVIQTSVDLSL